MVLTPPEPFRSIRRSRSLRGMGLVLGLAWLLLGAPLTTLAAPIISEIRSSASGRKLVVQIVASTPFSYAVLETHEPFRLSLHLPDATFAFPLTPLQLDDGPLLAVVPSEVTREDGTLALVQLTFARAAAYEVSREGTLLTVILDLPNPSGGRLLFEATAPAVPAQAEAAEASPAPPVSTAETDPAAVPATSSLTPASKDTTVQRLAIVTKGTVTTVRIDASGSLTYRATILTSPDRVVIDLPGAIYPRLTGRVPGQGPLLTRIRVSQFKGTPDPVVRVVLDLARPAPYRIEKLTHGLLIHAGERP